MFRRRYIFHIFRAGYEPRSLLSCLLPQLSRTPTTGALPHEYMDLCYDIFRGRKLKKVNMYEITNPPQI